VGGKGQQLADLLPLIPYARGYVEPFGGGGTVLLNRHPSELEVYNDLNEDVVTLFRVMRDPVQFAEFSHLVEHTPWSKDDFRLALALQQHARLGTQEVKPFERAWALYVIQNMGISGSHSKSQGNWSRSLADSKNTVKWYKRYEKLDAVHRRFRYVQIDSQDALACMLYWDAPDVVHYVDPPYVLDTRGGRAYYEYEMADEEHVRLVEVLLQLQGLVVLSGYDHPVYQPLVEAEWNMTEYAAHAYAKIVSAEKGEAKPTRVEAVWRNPACLAASRQLSLLDLAER
jgi:DNA adenine methylase